MASATSTSQASVALSSEATAKLQQLLESVSDSGYPDTVVGITNAAGQDLFLSGSKGADVDSIYWTASLTKLVASIAALQLVESGKLTLDDSLADIAPELSSRSKFVNADLDDLTTEPAKKDITLRHLLTHTSGLRYPSLDKKTHAWFRATHPDSQNFGAFDVPLSNEPGEGFGYGIGLEWAGQIIERLEGKSFGTYVQEHIFDPLGVTDATFAVKKRPDLEARLVGLHAFADGTFTPIPYLAPLIDPEFESGGGGLFSSAKAYLTVLSAVLAGGVSPTTGKRILRTETVEQMFEPQTLDVPDQGMLSTGVFPTAMPEMSLEVPLFAGRRAWTLSHLTNLDETSTGRSPGSAEWYGLASLFWTIDRKKGVAAVVFSQTLPLGLPQFLAIKDKVQEIIFAPRALVEKGQ